MASPKKSTAEKITYHLFSADYAANGFPAIKRAKYQ